MFDVPVHISSCHNGSCDEFALAVGSGALVAVAK